MKRACFLIVPFTVMAAALPVRAADRAPATPARVPAPAKPQAATKALTAGQVAFVDLATGKLIEPSPADAAFLARAPELQQSLNTSFEGLTEVKLPGDAGYQVNLEGRFQSALVATIGPDGKLRMGHPTSSVRADRK